MIDYYSGRLDDFFTQWPALYNHRLLSWRKRELGLTNVLLAKLTGFSRDTIREVFAGTASSKSVFPVTRVLGLDWAIVHDLALPEEQFHLAIRNGQLRGSQLIAPQRASGNSP